MPIDRNTPDKDFWHFDKDVIVSSNTVKPHGHAAVDCHFLHYDNILQIFQLHIGAFKFYSGWPALIPVFLKMETEIIFHLTSFPQSLFAFTPW